MSAIKCHFDGKTFVPDEPVQFPAGQAAEIHINSDKVQFTGGPGGTMGDLLNNEAIGGWAGIFDPDLDSTQIADELRRRASMGSYHKQHAMLELQEYWDERRRQQTPDKDAK